MPVNRSLNDWWYSHFSRCTVLAVGGPASLTIAGGRRSKLVFHPDPNIPGDVPGPYVYVKIKGTTAATASDTGTGTPSHYPGSELASAKLSLSDGDNVFHKVTGQTTDNGGATTAITNLEAIVKIPTQGLSPIWTPYLTVNTVAKLTSSNRTAITFNSRGVSETVWRGNSVDVNAYYESALTNYFAEISSNINIPKSWKKGTGPVSGLPDAYKQKNSAGVIINEPNSNAVLISSEPNDSTKNVWRLACLRNPDGSMDVESVVRWDLLSLQWTAPITLTAGQSGFTSPVFTWTKTGGGAIQPYAVPEDDIWDISGSNDCIRFTDEVSPTTFNLVVAEQNNSAASLENFYTVKWHYPLEPHHKRPDIHTFTWRRELSTLIDGAYFSDNNGNVVTETSPYQTEDTSIMPVIEAFLDAVDSGSELAPEGKELLQLFFKFGSKAADWYSEKNFPTSSIHFTTVEDAWGYSKAHQQTGNTTNDSDPSPIGGLVPLDLMSDEDGYLRCAHQVHEVVHYRRESWACDSYGRHGYLSNKGIMSDDEALGVNVEVQFIKVR